MKCITDSFLFCKFLPRCTLLFKCWTGLHFQVAETEGAGGEQRSNSHRPATLQRQTMAENLRFCRGQWWRQWWLNIQVPRGGRNSRYANHNCNNTNPHRCKNWARIPAISTVSEKAQGPARPAKGFLVGPKPPCSVCAERSQSGNDSSASRPLNHRRKKSESARGVQPRPALLRSRVNRQGDGQTISHLRHTHTNTHTPMEAAPPTSSYSSWQPPVLSPWLKVAL